jgi:hypothetical protein
MQTNKIFWPPRAEIAFSNTLTGNRLPDQDAKDRGSPSNSLTLKSPESQPYLDPLQLTNRRSRTLLTSPSIKKNATMFDPPELISGRGIPVTGILPTTIPTFTKT